MQNNQDNTVFSESPSIGEGCLSPGSMVGDKYQIVSLIGSGGMGTVYRVQQVFLGKEFALKILDLHKRSDVTVKRFQQEARTASQLQHPNLVEVHDFDVFGGGQPYLVMDLVQGVTLSAVLKARGALPVDYVVNLCIQICFGLMYAHEKGVIHRDIKPGNIMLLHPDKEVSEGTIKIVDFGIAKLTQSEDGEIQALTKTGEIFGSPVYMSPEQCKGTAVDRRSDIYSLGCVMFECLTGAPPFLGDTAMATMLKRLSDEPTSLKETAPGCEFPAVLERIVRRMLAVDPADRYQELGVLIKDLMTLQRPDDGVKVSAEIKEEKEEKKAAVNFKTILLAAAVAAAVALATLAFDRLIVLPKLISQSAASSSYEPSLE
jgi:serine/threonine-protein kinase